MLALTSPELAPSAEAYACPACLAKGQAVQTAEYSVAEAARHFCTETRNRDRNERLQRSIARLWGSNACVVVHCRNCGFGHSVPFVAGDEEFYSILHEEHDYPRWRWEYDFALTEGNVPARVGRPLALDIGGGAGHFLQKLPSRWQRYGVEQSPGTREILRRQGVTVFESVTEAVAEYARRFHLITLFQVLEHIADFETLLAACAKLLDEGGRLIISVPDAGAMLEQERVTGCPDMPPNHVVKWTPGSLDLVLRRAGFTVTRVEHERASLKTIAGALHLMILSDAAKPGSLTGRVYRLANRRLRVAFLLPFAIGAAIGLLARHWRYATRGGSFAIAAEKRL
jgi:SAM-dependent methyltransferase